MALISVIIPIYNAGKYLRACLDSIVNQTYRDLEIILINDGSTDDSLSLCREYEEKDERILVINQANAGVSTARNRGIEKANGDWISFVDSDDYLELDAYEHCIGIINEHKCDAVCYEFFTNFVDKQKQHEMPRDRYGILNRRETVHLLHNGIPFTWCFLFNKRIIADVRFDVEIARGEDTLFNVQVLHRANTVYFTPKPLYHYVQSEQSACRGAFRPKQLTALKLMDFYPSFFAEHYPEMLNAWYCTMCNLMITLYYDMYADSIDYKEQQKDVGKKFNQVYRLIKKRELSLKNRIKYSYFCFMPKIFCFTHKVSLLFRK